MGLLYTNYIPADNAGWVSSYKTSISVRFIKIFIQAESLGMCAACTYEILANWKICRILIFLSHNSRGQPHPKYKAYVVHMNLRHFSPLSLPLLSPPLPSPLLSSPSPHVGIVTTTSHPKTVSQYTNIPILQIVQ